MNKILYIIPGIGESTNDAPYAELANFGKRNGYKVIPVSINWKRKVATDWVNQFNCVVEKHGAQNSIVIGFSFGAYITAIASKNYKFKKIFFCSLSPYFKDDLKNLPPLALKILGEKRMEDFKKYAFPKKIDIPAIFIIGDKDFPLLISRVKKSYKSWIGKKEIKILKEVDHNLNNELYLKTLKKYLKK